MTAHVELSLEDGLILLRLITRHDDHTALRILNAMIAHDTDDFELMRERVSFRGRPVCLDDLAVWPDDSWCHVEDLEEFLMSKSDDYKIVPYDSLEAAWHTGALEDGCKALFGHEYWQVLNTANERKLREYLGIRDTSLKFRKELRII